MADGRRITLNRNGIKSHGFMVLVPDTMEELLKLASEKLQFEAAYLFSENGALVDDIRLIRDNDVLYVAADGEGFVEMNPRVIEEPAGMKRKSDHLDVKSDQLDASDEEPVKLFVGSLNKNLSQDDVQKMFAEYGQVAEVKVLTDKLTGKSKGAAFVRYTTRAAGERAIQARNGQLLPGMPRPMTVKFADGDPAALEVGEHKLFVGSLPKTITEPELREIFSQWGSPSEVILLRNNQQSRGAGAFVKYKYRKEALNAINSGHGQLVQGQPMVVRFADQKPSHSSQMLLGNLAVSAGAPPFARLSQMNLGGVAVAQAGHAPFCPMSYGYQVCSCGAMHAASITQPPNKRGGFQMNTPQIPQSQQIQAIQQAQQHAQQLQALQQQALLAQQQQQQQQVPQPPGPYGTY